jgi:hypothetical protein
MLYHHTLVLLQEERTREISVIAFMVLHRAWLGRSVFVTACLDDFDKDNNLITELLLYS